MTDNAIATLQMFTLDAPDAAKLAEFWHAVLGWPIVVSDENYAMLQGDGPALGIGTIPDYTAPAWPDNGHKQYHFDLAVQDVEAAAKKCVAAGATRPEEQPGDTWVVLLDPAGHPFCLTDAKNWQ